ncbi:hypothetical protein L596_020338 [Steinernema carpocapsae]|uniref:F-box domain-containing protein n=1 Tax=Steinernema carpocapsae TaxID=34508 RepID=A0A4U5MTA7_STECR|nr:hypothetical protein L596_020338 [Steinernema carpocapsae]
MNSVPLIFSLAVQAHLKLDDIKTLNHVDSQTWQKDPETHKSEIFDLALYKDFKEDRQKWFFFFSNSDYVPVSFEFAMAKQATLRLRGVYLVGEFVSNHFIRESSPDQIENRLLPFIQEHLESRPEYLDYCNYDLSTKFDFGRRVFDSLCLRYFNEVSLEILSRHVESKRCRRLSLVLSWPSKIKWQLVEFLRKPGVGSLEIHSSYFSLPSEAFFVVFKRFLQDDSFTNFTLRARIDLESWHVVHFFKELQSETRSKYDSRDFRWATERKELFVQLREDAVILNAVYLLNVVGFLYSSVRLCFYAFVG